MKPDEKQAKLFAQYIGDKKIVVADESNTSRVSIANALSKMGAKGTNIVMASSITVAQEEVDRVKPEIIIADYDMGKGTGLDLLQQMRKNNKDMKKCLFVLVTGNTSQSAVAKAAEEDVDTYILKPFTSEVLRISILKSALQKISPPPYITTIDLGKDQLEAAKFDEAIATFTKAMTMDPAPSLACFYLGQAKMIKKAAEEAEGDYHQGLSYNKIHYKCLVGLFDVMISKKRHKDAYEIIKKVSHYFPANPQRLTQVLRLAIVTQSYEDVERYYRIFTNIDTRNDEMIKYICAALVVCGKYYLQQNSNTRALELFQKAGVTGAGRTKILKEIIFALMEFNMPTKATEFLARFPAETHTSADYLSMDLLIREQTDPLGKVLEYARELVKKEVKEPIVYEITIRKSMEAQHNDYAENMAQKAGQLWPEKKEYFLDLLTKKKQPA